MDKNDFKKECSQIIDACKKNPWLNDLVEYPLYDYPYYFERISSAEEMHEVMYHGNMSIRTGYLYRDLAFIQQVNGGDEWLALKKENGNYASFESISFRGIILRDGDEGFYSYLEKLVENNTQHPQLQAVPSFLNVSAQGKTGFYQVQKTLDIVKMIDLLWEVRTAKDRLPTLSDTESQRLLDYSRTMLPISTSTAVHLFKPLSVEEYEKLYHGFTAKPNNELCTNVNYDADRLAFTHWQDGELMTTAGPLSGILSAYGNAIIQRNSSSIILNNDEFAARLENVCIQSTLEQGGNTPEFTMEMNM